MSQTDLADVALVIVLLFYAALGWAIWRAVEFLIS